MYLIHSFMCTDMTQLFSDYQYLMKIWTVCLKNLLLNIEYFFLYFQHPWLLRPYFIEYHNKRLKDDDQTDPYNIFEEDFDVDNSKPMEISPTRNLLSLSIKNILNITPEENALNAMKEQWWFNIFEPNNSQFDVSSIL
jgi:hypothetical protein